MVRPHNLFVFFNGLCPNMTEFQSGLFFTLMRLLQLILFHFYVNERLCLKILRDFEVPKAFMSF